ncbi:7185_t:CDS:1, partial [Diversispora eburnea]
FEWYKKAAENNEQSNINNKSQYSTGTCFYFGRGTEKDIIKTIY